MLTDTDKRTLTNVQRVVRSLGNTPLANNLDDMIARIVSETPAEPVTPSEAHRRMLGNDARWIGLTQGKDR